MDVIELTDEQWDKQYRPINNPLSKDSQTFETYGADLEFVLAQNPDCIWTELDGDDGGVYITNGMAYVNRIAYYITEVPFDPETSIEICVLSPEESCKCEDCDDTDSWEDGWCKECIREGCNQIA